MSYYLSKAHTSPQAISLKRFNQELFFLSYIVCKTISFKNSKVCGITKFTKICTNYVEDWNETYVSPYRPFVDITANPFGMTSYIPTPFLETKLNEKKVFVYELDMFAAPKKLWKKVSLGDYKNVIFEIEAEELKKILKSGYHNQIILSKSFSNLECNQADTLSLIYQFLDLEELNILASHRDLRKSRMCLDYITRTWSTKFYYVISSLKNNIFDEDLVKNINRIIESTIQINIKIQYIIKGVPSLIQKIETEIIFDLEDRTAKDILGDIANSLNRKAPLVDKKEFKDYFIFLKKLKLLNLSEIIPLNIALLKYLEKTSFLDSNKIKEHKHSLESLISNNNYSLDSEKTILPDLKNIEDIFNDLVTREFNLFRRIRGIIRWENRSKR